MKKTQTNPKKTLDSPSVLSGSDSLPPYHKIDLRLIRSLFQMRDVISKRRMGCSAQEGDKGNWTQNRGKIKAQWLGSAIEKVGRVNTGFLSVFGCCFTSSVD